MNIKPLVKTAQFTAVILNAHRDGERISGNVYCDREGRFRDGEYITTSLVVEQTSDTTVRTKNSIYKLVWRL